MQFELRRVLVLALLTLNAAGCYDPNPPAPAYIPKIHAQEQNNFAAAALREGDLPRALQHAEAAVAEDPDFVAARVNLANAQARLGRFDEAAATLDKGAAEDPAIAQAHLFRGLFLDQDGRAPEAQAAFARSVAAYDQAIAAGRVRPEDHVNRAIAVFLGRGQTHGLKAINDVVALYPGLRVAGFMRDRMLDNDRGYFVRWLFEPGAGGVESPAGVAPAAAGTP